MLGQGGAITSFGMYSLARQLKALSGKVTCTVHGWQEVQAVADAIRQQPEDAPIILIGYSLGGNSVTQIAEAVRVPIALLVAYDASVLQAAPGIRPMRTNVKRALCYRSTNYLLPFGHGQLTGPQVETTLTPDTHIAVCYDAALHAKTIAAVKELL